MFHQKSQKLAKREQIPSLPCCERLAAATSNVYSPSKQQQQKIYHNSICGECSQITVPPLKNRFCPPLCNKSFVHSNCLFTRHWIVCERARAANASRSENFQSNPIVQVRYCLLSILASFWTAFPKRNLLGNHLLVSIRLHNHQCHLKRFSDIRFNTYQRQSMALLGGTLQYLQCSRGLAILVLVCSSSCPKCK